VVSEYLNYNVNPFLAKIKKTSENVWGKEIKRLVKLGVSGGVGAGTEDGDLPTPCPSGYYEFVITLKNLYGTIELTDKAIRASQNKSGAFVNILNEEISTLLKTSEYNFSRMLFGNGSGKLGNIMDIAVNTITLDDSRNITAGMSFQIYKNDGSLLEEDGTIHTVSYVDYKTHKLIVTPAIANYGDALDGFITSQGAYNNEITGLKAIFSEEGNLYGLNKATHSWLKPYVKKNAGAISEQTIQMALDTIEENAGSTVNFIVCSWGVRRALQNLFAKNKRFIDTLELAGGYKALSYNGIPIVADRFCPEGTMYLLNTNDFTLHQLCDWQWLEGEDGKVLKQVAGKPVYTATLVKYADLICARPNGQGMISGITEE
jgi:hypothetical protein